MVEITCVNPELLKGPVKVKEEPGLEGPRSRPEGMADRDGRSRHAHRTRREGSPAPTQQNCPGDSGIHSPPGFNDGPGDDPDEGDDGDDDGDDHPNKPANNGGGNDRKSRKDKRKGTQ